MIGGTLDDILHSCCMARQKVGVYGLPVLCTGGQVCRWQGCPRVSVCLPLSVLCCLNLIFMSPSHKTALATKPGIKLEWTKDCHLLCHLLCP